MIATAIILFILGAVIGSFLNVCIYRIPRGQSIVTPASRCPACKEPLKWYDNVPVVSYFWLKGRCRRCGRPISIQYPMVELLNAVLFLLAALHFGPTWALLPALLFISTLIVIFFIDIERLIIPNVIVLPVAVVGLAVGIAVAPSRWLELILAGLFSAAFFFAITFIRPGGMGMGDVKLAAMLGFFLGTSVLVALFLSFLMGAILGVTLIAFGVKGRKSRLPFGPFLAVGALIALFYGERLLAVYTGLFQ